MKTVIKSSVYAMLTVTLLSVAVVFTAPTKKAHASLLWDIAGATYLYKNRKTLTNMYNEAKTKGHVYGVPKLKVIVKGQTKDQLGVITKKGVYKLGWYNKRFVSDTTKYMKRVKEMYVALYEKGKAKWKENQAQH